MRSVNLRDLNICKLLDEKTGRLLFQILFSIGLSLVIWRVFFSGMLDQVDKSTQWFLSFGIVSSFTTLMLVSRFVFAVGCLCTITCFSKEGRGLFMALMASTMLEPQAHIIENFQTFGKSIICNMELAQKLVDYKIKLSVEPVINLFPKLRRRLQEADDVEMMVQDMVEPLSHALGKGGTFTKGIMKKMDIDARKDNRKEKKKIPEKTWQEKAKENKKKMEDRRKELKPTKEEINSNSVQGLSAHAKAYQQMINKTCSNMTDNVAKECGNKCGGMQEKCITKFAEESAKKAWYIQFLLWLLPKKNFCKQMQRPCSSGCNEGLQKMKDYCDKTNPSKASENDMEGILDEYEKNANQSVGGFNLDYKLLINTTKARINVPTFKGFVLNVKMKFHKFGNLIRMVRFGLKLFMILTLVRKFKKANGTVHGFLTDDEHKTNNRITPYFRTVDEELNPNVKLYPISPLLNKQFKLSTNTGWFDKPDKKEMKGLLRSIANVLAVAFTAGFMHSGDAAIAHGLNTISQLTAAEIEIQGRNHISLTVYGKGFMARFVRDITEYLVESMTGSTNLNQTSYLHGLYNNKECLIHVDAYGGYDLIWFAFLVFMFTQTVFSFALSRSQVKVLAYLFPTTEKKRILCLFNKLGKFRARVWAIRRIQIQKQLVESANLRKLIKGIKLKVDSQCVLCEIRNCSGRPVCGKCFIFKQCHWCTVRYSNRLHDPVCKFNSEYQMCPEYSQKCVVCVARESINETRVMELTL